MDYLLQIAVSDLEHFSRFLLDRLLAQAGVADVNSSFVLRTVKAFRGLPLPGAWGPLPVERRLALVGGGILRMPGGLGSWTASSQYPLWVFAPEGRSCNKN